MAIGDSAASLGYPLVPESGEQGKVRLGWQEINRTRDLVADVKKALDSRFIGNISYGTTVPPSTAGAEGDIFLKIV